MLTYMLLIVQYCTNFIQYQYINKEDVYMNETLELKDCFRIFNGKESERDIDLVEKVDMPTCDDIDILNRLPMSDSCIMFKVQNILMNTFLNKSKIYVPLLQIAKRFRACSANTRIDLLFLG